jgi:hypothetical protein
MAVGHQIRSISNVAVLATAQVYEKKRGYEQYKRNSRVPGAGQVIQVTEAEAEEGKRKWKLWAAAGDGDSDVQNSMEEDEDDTVRNLDEEMQDAIDNEEEEEEVNSVTSADSCHDTDGDYTGSENEMGAEITNDQVQADRHTDWDDASRLNSVSESSSESEEVENARHEQWRASARRKRLTASDIISDESDIEENGNEGDIETVATVTMTARMEVTAAAAVVQEQAFQATLENAKEVLWRTNRKRKRDARKEERNTGRNRTRRANEDPGATPRATR